MKKQQCIKVRKIAVLRKNIDKTNGIMYNRNKLFVRRKSLKKVLNIWLYILCNRYFTLIPFIYLEYYIIKGLPKRNSIILFFTIFSLSILSAFFYNIWKNLHNSTNLISPFYSLITCFFQLYIITINCRSVGITIQSIAFVIMFLFAWRIFEFILSNSMQKFVYDTISILLPLITIILL